VAHRNYPARRKSHKVIKDIMSLNEAPFGEAETGHKEDIYITQPQTINESCDPTASTIK